MKNIKFILLCLIAVFLFCSLGCGGGGGNLVSENNENQQPTDDEDYWEIAIEHLLNELLAIREDGSFALFDYSPLFDEMETGGTELKFAKYISSKDLVSGVSKDCFIQKIQLDAGTDYIIKYSHAGRNLNQTALDLKITMPDSREMIPDFTGISNITKTPYAEEDFGDKNGLDSGDIARGLTLEQVLAEEMELEAKANAETTIEPYYVSADFEVIPEENPCIILYWFKVPVSGNYEFTIKENMLTSGDQFNVTDSPFEFRLYSVNFSEDDSGKEDYGDYYIELTPHGMLDLQRFLLDMATKFNENGLPIEFESSQSDEFSASGFMPASYEEVRQEIRNRLNQLDEGLRILAREEEKEKRWGNTSRLWRIHYMQRMLERKKEEEVSNVQVIVDPIINNVPYDDIFDAGAGFYAHSGMHAITGNAINDDDFSDNAVVNFNAPKPSNGKAENMKSTLKATLIGTEEEHDSVKELDATSNFALIRNALGLNNMKDYIRIGSVGAKTMVVRYDYIEESPRYFTTDKYELNEGALALLKKNPDLFQREHGDYFVAGYTWGLRYEATIEITAGEYANYAKRGERVLYDGSKYYVWEDRNNDKGVVCDKAAELLKKLFECSKRVAENDNADDKNRVENLLDILTKNDHELDRNKYEECFYGLNISVKTGIHTGMATNASQNLREFVNNLTNYMRNAKNRKKSEYEPIYVTLVRYRELEEARPYIPEYLPVKKDLYNRIRELTTKIYRTRCYYNALAAIPDDHLIGGSSLRASWEREFSGLIDGMKLSLNKICSDIDSVNSYYDNFDKLFQKYKSLCERYTFFRYFLNESNKDYGGGWDEPCGSGGYKAGFWSYDKSKIVQEDFAAGSGRFDHEEPCTSGPGGAHFYVSWSDQRVTGFETGYVNTNYSKAHDNQNRTLGKRKINWSYKCASSRRMEVYLKFQTVRMTDDLYPFAGFDD